ncbi:DJ-1/PfpI/YhbO family deglycase/protease [Rickettsiella endosymbiont of Xylota segnis]|uniref:DJ-1/PfpI/YhbO family deglycase/protease n=1 Tax=Rickettsiella endosymbiont of Xylota segnis TaxID=3066238 RepID=UPI0030D56967
MDINLSGKKILIITSNTGVEKSELLVPIAFLKKLNAEITHAAIHRGKVQTLVNDVDKDEIVKASTDLSSIHFSEYDALIIPGGTVNSDKLRIDPQAVKLVSEFARNQKLIAAICHAPWILIEAKLVAGREMTSYYSIKTDLINAGAKWLDQAVVTSNKEASCLITSRQPKDLDNFSKAIAHELNKQKH